MGLLKLFSKPASAPARLPSGSFTVDRDGDILVSTLPQTFSVTLTREIGRHVLQTFRAAQAARLPLSELVVHYASLKLTARDLRGGAIVFLAPRTPMDPTT
jgi:hypothetical protein